MLSASSSEASIADSALLLLKEVLLCVVFPILDVQLVPRDDKRPALLERQASLIVLVLPQAQVRAKRGLVDYPPVRDSHAMREYLDIRYLSTL